MCKYVIEDIKSIIINGKEYPWSPCDIEMTQEEIRGGLGTYHRLASRSDIQKQNGDYRLR